MTQALRILVLVGSVREGRLALPVANWVLDSGSARADLALERVDLADWALPFFPHPKPPATGDYPGDSQRAWAAKVASADGFLLVAPEYNHGPSAVLKNALDTVFAEWGRKPVGFVAYGGVGGARAVEQLRLTACALDMAPLGSAVHLIRPGAKREGDRFNGDAHDAKALAALFDDLAWWGAALRAARG